MKRESCSVMSDSLPPHGQNTGVGGLSLLQGIFPTQGSNPGLPHRRRILHKGSPRILEWIAFPVSSGSSWPRNWAGVSCIAAGFFTNWAIREVLSWVMWVLNFQLTKKIFFQLTLKLFRERERKETNIVKCQSLGNLRIWSWNFLLSLQHLS